MPTSTLTPGETERYAQNLSDFAQLCRTDPAFTKPVQGHGGYTSTDSFYLLTRAITHYGPVGVGFGWDITAHHLLQATGGAPDQTLMVIEIAFWTRERSNAFSELGSWPLYETTKDKTLRLDDDAPAKALTRALSKALSRLGLCADIFLGCQDKRPEDRAHPEMYLTYLETIVHGSPDPGTANLPIGAVPTPAAPRPSTPRRGGSACPPSCPPENPDEPKPPTPDQLTDIRSAQEKLGPAAEEIIAKALAHYRVETINNLTHTQAQKLLDRLILET